MKTLRKRCPYLLLCLAATTAACLLNAPAANTLSQPTNTIALVGGSLIDGTGAAPIPQATLIIQDGKVAAVGATGQVPIPKEAKIIKLKKNATILPGLINAHVHGAFDANRLQTWAQAGVTSVRDLQTHGETVAQIMALRAGSLNRENYARIFTAGPMITVPGGYGNLFVASPADAREKVLDLINAGVDVIKISLEDGYAGTGGLPKLTPDELAAIITAAHERGKRVSLHITQARYLEQGVAAGVDEIAHLPYDPVPTPVFQDMVRKNIYLTPTLTVFRNFGAPIPICIANLRDFIQAGGQVALGNDFMGGPGLFETGIPMYEIECMRQAGMTPMEIIVAATRNGAYVCGQADHLGTLEPGKNADVLVVKGDPLQDLNVLGRVLLVIKAGKLIRSK